MSGAGRWAALWVVLLAGRALADPPVVLRFSTIIPEGSAYAREASAFARDVETGSQGRVRVKWIFGGIAGDELQALDRVRRGQIDGAASALACGHLAPSLRVFRLPGLFDDRQQARQVMARLRASVEQELRKSGFALLGLEPFGADIILSRAPVRLFDELKRARLWVWDQDEVWRAVAPLMGLTVAPLPLEEVSHALAERRIDGVIALPTAALAYQWPSHLRYFTPLDAAYLQACLIVSNRAFDALSLDDQRMMRAAGAKAAARFDKVCDAQDAQLKGSLFEKQGLKRIAVTPELRSAFITQARQAGERIDELLVPRALRERVAGWLAELRRAP